MAEETQAPEENSLAAFMEPVLAVFRPEDTVGAVIERLREVSRQQLFTYAYVADPAGKLIGVVVMRELLFASKEDRLESIMLTDPFFLKPEAKILDVIPEIAVRQYPQYPVCDDSRRLIGTVRGAKLFEAQAIEISAQPGSMVGVEKEERLATPWPKSFRFRHPWLQLNLLTAFVAGAVVSLFQETIDEMVILAAFLPVVAGQSGNTGCQALAVTLRGMTLGDFKKNGGRQLVAKEALLGLMNGFFVGFSAAFGMYALASYQGHQHPAGLAAIVLVAMTGSCVISGISGAMVPLTLRKLGADPATASSIFLTTMTDVASMGLLLSLATMLLV